MQALSKLKKMLKSNKGFLDMRSITDNVLQLGVVAFVVVFLVVIFSEFGGMSVVNSTANATINSFIDALSDVADWFPIIVLMIIFLVLLGGVMLVLYFVGRGKR